MGIELQSEKFTRQDWSDYPARSIMRNAMMAVRPVCNFIARVFWKVDGNDQLTVIGGES